MRSKTVPVSNVKQLLEAGNALMKRESGMPGMGLVEGNTGAGKTTAIAWLANRVDGVYVRARAVWTPKSMLEAILHELDLPGRNSCAAMVGAIIDKLLIENRPLFIDEADYVIDSKRMVETLRDLHDESTVPVILIGMSGIGRKISSRKQLAGRIAQWVTFGPCDMHDARMLADSLCEINVEDALLERLHQTSNGSIRLMVVGLSHIEEYARSRGREAIDLCDWPKDKELFFRSRTERATTRTGATV